MNPIKPSVLVLFCIIVTGVCGKDLTLNELPDGVSAEILGILANGTVKISGGCKETEPADVKFFLYNRDSTNGTIEVNRNETTGIDANKPVILLIHGWISSVSTDGLQVLKDAYLQRYDCNVIGVDWSGLARQLYTKSFCNLPGVAEVVADFLCSLTDFGVQVDQVHLVGHSMGAQISGITGQKTQEKCSKKIGRITGLDPAGPLYQGLPVSRRLDETDANFVDVIHTNAGQFGYIGATGSVDFYVNCGTIQPHCPGGISHLSVTQLLDLAVSVVTCPHTISWHYMASSVNDDSKKFTGTSCAVCRAVVCAPDPLVYTTSKMGEHSPRNPKSRQYVTVIATEPLYKL